MSDSDFFCYRVDLTTTDGATETIRHYKALITPYDWGRIASGFLSLIAGVALTGLARQTWRLSGWLGKSADPVPTNQTG